MIVLIRDQYSEEDLQIIGCPSQEQVRLAFRSFSSVDHRRSRSDKPADLHVLRIEIISFREKKENRTLSSLATSVSYDIKNFLVVLLSLINTPPHVIMPCPSVASSQSISDFSNRSVVSLACLHSNHGSSVCSKKLVIVGHHQSVEHCP